MISCRSIGESSIPGQCKQSCSVSVQVHALFSIRVCQHRHQFYGHSFPSCAPWRLSSRCFLHHLLYLLDKCCNRILGELVSNKVVLSLYTIWFPRGLFPYVQYMSFMIMRRRCKNMNKRSNSP